MNPYELIDSIVIQLPCLTQPELSFSPMYSNSTLFACDERPERSATSWNTPLTRVVAGSATSSPTEKGGIDKVRRGAKKKNFFSSLHHYEFEIVINQLGWE